MAACVRSMITLLRRTCGHWRRCGERNNGIRKVICRGFGINAEGAGTSGNNEAFLEWTEEGSERSHSLAERQENEKRAAFAAFTLDTDHPSMLGHYLLCDSQPHAGPVGLGGEVEVKNPAELLSGDA